MNRRSFLKLGSLFAPVVTAPTVAYSFLWANPDPHAALVGLPPLPAATFNGIPFPDSLRGVADDDHIQYRCLRPGARAQIVRSLALYISGRRMGTLRDVSYDAEAP
jgi:hypothetical protein